MLNIVVFVFKLLETTFRNVLYLHVNLFAYTVVAFAKSTNLTVNEVIEDFLLV